MEASGGRDRHAWRTRSRHLTSDGVVTYQSCACGLSRVVLERATVLADHIKATRRAGAFGEQGPASGAT